MLPERQAKILAVIVEQYVFTKEPVGSMLLAESKRWPVSSATLRNEMSELEGEGYITHQHTSSGRLPTAKGYRYYVDNFLKPSKVGHTVKNKLSKAFEHGDDSDAKVKSVARELAELAGAAIIILFHRGYFYYTGFSYLLVQPEFTNRNLLTHLGESLDTTEENIESILPKLHHGINIFIGEEIGFTAPCTFIASPRGSEGEGMVGILGPMRMDYNRNCGLLSFVDELIS